MRRNSKEFIHLIILAALSIYLFFFRSHAIALTDPDETFYAQTAKEMLVRGEWVTPYLYGKPQFEKPIFFYWLLELSFKIFGVNEFAARLPSGIFALFGIIAIYILGSVLFSRRVGFLAAISLATNVEYIILSRACVTDMVLFTFMLSGVLFFLLGYLKGKSLFYLFSSAAFGLATLTKGPIAVILPGAAIAAYLFLVKDLKATKRMPFFSAAAVFFIIVLPWYLLMYKLHAKDFVDVFFGFHNITRFLESEHEIGSNPFYNVPILLGGFFPWSAFLPFGLWRIFKKAFSKDKGSIFVLVWFFIIFIFFSISSTKLPTYIFPSFVSLALIVGVLWDDFLKGEDRGIAKGVKSSYYLLLILVAVGAVSSYIYAKFDYQAISSSVFISSLFLIFGFAFSLFAFANKKFIESFLLIAYAVGIVLYPITKLTLPEIEPYETSKYVSEKLLSLMKPEERLGSESNYLSGLAFYTGKIPIDVDRHNTLVKFLTSKERVWCVLKEKNHTQLYTLDTKPHYKEPTYMVYNVGKRAIITNKVPDDGKYIVKRERLLK